MYIGVVYGVDAEKEKSTPIRWYYDKVKENVEAACQWRANVESPRGCGDYWADYEVWEIPESLALWLMDFMKLCEDTTQCLRETSPEPT